MRSAIRRDNDGKGLEEIRRQRLSNQGISDRPFDRPEEVVRWLGAVQAQDYGGAKWAIGLRMGRSSDESIEKAFNGGKFLRTHLLRPTLHFVAADDVHWMLGLTSARTRALWNSYYRNTGIDAETFRRSNDALVRALAGGNHLTRSEVRLVFKKACVNSEGLRFGFLMSRAEHDAIVCSGAKRGAQQTYALLDERAPVRRKLEHQEALAELALRYFRSHGPATAGDFAWWSGYPLGDAQRTLESVKPCLDSEAIDGKIYWFPASTAAQAGRGSSCQLLPNFDEYLVGYADRGLHFDKNHRRMLGNRPDILSHHTIICNGEVAGTWKRSLVKGGVRVSLFPFQKLPKRHESGLGKWIKRYKEFLRR